MEQDKDLSIRKRKRGVVASRAKLTTAMANAGLKTQFSLAERIASIENLESIPKDVVSKIFREQPVEAASLERIANALGVEAYKLYRTHQEVEVALQLAGRNDGSLNSSVQPELQFTPRKHQPILKNKFSWLFVVCILVISLYWWLSVKKHAELPISPTITQISPKLGRLSMLVVGQSGDINDLALNSLHPLLIEEFNVSQVIADSPILTNEEDLPKLAEQYQSDLVLYLVSKEEGNFITVDAWIYAEQQVIYIWSVNSRTVEFIHDSQRWLKDLYSSILFLIGQIDYPDSSYSYKVDSDAKVYYLEGRNLLDKSQAELNFKSAQSRFIHALNFAPNYAEAHAGLCESLLLESWMGNEKNLLEEAQQSCSQALTLAPHNDYVVSVVSDLYRRTGRIPEALLILATSTSNSVDLLLSRAYTFYEAYRQGIDLEDALLKAKFFAEKAINLAPQFWKPYHALGLIELNLANTQAAIDAFSQAVKYDANELMLTNLGTLNFCQDNLKQALDNYHLAIQMAPESHLGFEMLGMVKYFMGDYTQALQLRLQAVGLLKEVGIHQVWGAIADSHLLLRQTNEAILQYQQALTLVERDRLRGNLSLNDEAHQLYYQLQIEVLSGKNYSNNEARDSRLSELENNLEHLDSSGIVKLALVEQQLQRFSKARSLINTAVSICPVYKKLPQFKQEFETQL